LPDVNVNLWYLRNSSLVQMEQWATVVGVLYELADLAQAYPQIQLHTLLWTLDSAYIYRRLECRRLKPRLQTLLDRVEEAKAKFIPDTLANEYGGMKAVTKVVRKWVEDAAST